MVVPSLNPINANIISRADVVTNWTGDSIAQNTEVVREGSVQSDMNTKLDDLKTRTDSLPTLSDIESSTVLAKESSVSVIDGIVSNLPVLSELRNEMINVQFGGLEIANNQMTIKDQNGVTIAIFDLLDQNGSSTMSSVFKRTLV